MEEECKDVSKNKVDEFPKAEVSQGWGQRLSVRMSTKAVGEGCRDEG